MAAPSFASEPARAIARSIGVESTILASDNIRYQNSSTNVIATRFPSSPIVLAMETPDGDIIRKTRKALKWSQRALASKVGLSQPAIKKIESGETKDSKFLWKLWNVLEQASTASTAAEAEIRSVDSPAARYGLDNFPIHAAAEAGAGHVIVEHDAYEHVPRPSFIRNLKDAYGILIKGESMLPVYKPGSIVVVGRSEPLITGEDYIFYSEKNGEGRAMIKTLRSYADAAWTLQQWNPSKTFTTSRREWRWAHRVLGNYSRR